MAGKLTDAYLRAEAARAEVRAPSSVRGTLEHLGWSAREVAQRFDVSERTARRWRQQGRVPARKAEQFDREARGAVQAAELERVRTRIAGARAKDAEGNRTGSRSGGRGLRGMSVTGRYKVSRTEAEAHGYLPVWAPEGVPGSALGEFYDLLEAGDEDGAEDALAEALSDAYGTDGGSRLDWLRVDSLSITLR